MADLSTLCTWASVSDPSLSNSLLKIPDAMPINIQTKIGENYEHKKHNLFIGLLERERIHSH